MKTLLFSLLTFVLLFSSCQKEYDKETCNELSMMAFKGSPNHASEFQESCQDIEIKYTKKVCQDALNDLIMSGNLAAVKKSYGERVDGCFTENDLRTFQKDKEKD